jgi:DNA-binding NarL/FixJ family response regulator
MPVKILLVDDHQIIRDGLRLLFRDQPDMQVVGDAFNAEAAWQAIAELKPDVVVLDVELPGDDGLTLAERLHTTYPEIKVIMLTAHAEKEYVNQALRIGAAGYLLKLNACAQLLEAVRAVTTGQVYLSPEVSTVLVREYQRQLQTGGRDDGLTARELEILKRLAEGQTTKEIAFALKVSAKTVETHRLNLMAKLGLRNLAELTKYALREGLIRL